jgi:hypothetical protein
MISALSVCQLHLFDYFIEFDVDRLGSRNRKLVIYASALVHVLLFPTFVCLFYIIVFKVRIKVSDSAILQKEGEYLLYVIFGAP